MNRISSTLKTSEIEASKMFQRLTETTQVLFPQNGQKDIITTRHKHSYEVRTSAMLMVESMSTSEIDVDYQKSIGNVCLLHDCGHILSHTGADVLSNGVKARGLKEGFDDNANNFVVIESAQLNLEPYDLASLIKYPNKLYSEQKSKYLKFLKDSIDEDIKYFKSKGFAVTKKPERTVACEIMDEADRNTYVSTDLSDCFCLGLGNEKAFEELYNNDMFSCFTVREILAVIIAAIKSGNKSLIKRAFSRFKDSLNQNYILDNNLQLRPINKELIELREYFYSIEMDIFINSKKAIKERNNCEKYLNFYIHKVFDEGYTPSKRYKREIEAAATLEEKLKLKRNMIAEATDWYIKNFYSKNKRK